MKIVTVIPLKKNIWRDNLSYFTAQEAPLGSLVSVPVRNEQVLALVIASREVSDLKSELKTADWQCRKLNRVKKPNYLDSALIEAAQKTADYFASPTGPVVKAMIPQAVLDKLPDNRSPIQTPKEKVLVEAIAFQEPDAERLARYKSLIREAFAKKQSVYLCLPTSADINRMIEPLSRGIEKFVLIGHGNLSAGEQVEVWKKALTVNHPILFVGTPLFLSLPRPDFTTLILDRENSSAYKMMNRPFIDWRYLAENLAKLRGWRLVMGDSALRAETIYRLGRNEVGTLGPIKYRFLNSATSQIIPYQEKNGKEKNLNATNERLRERIENALDHQENIFIFTGRRGLAPITLCRDCGTMMVCDICGSALAIHQVKKERIFLCHKCGQVVEIEDECRVCRGQRLAVIGFGVEKIIEEIGQAYPRAKIFRLDSDSIKNQRRAEEVANQFYKTPGAILVGTELALNYLNKPINNVLAIGLDTFLALPDWRASEKLFDTLLRLKQLANKHFIIQTRQPDEKIFSYINSGNLIDFFRDELAERQDLGYPPFKIIIKISLAGQLNEIRKEMTELGKLLGYWHPLLYPDLNKNAKGQPIVNLLLRLPVSYWPDPEMIKILKNLNPNFVVNVDPLSIL